MRKPAPITIRPEVSYKNHVKNVKSPSQCCFLMIGSSASNGLFPAILWLSNLTHTLGFPQESFIQVVTRFSPDKIWEISQNSVWAGNSQRKIYISIYPYIIFSIIINTYLKTHTKKFLSKLSKVSADQSEYPYLIIQSLLMLEISPLVEVVSPIYDLKKRQKIQILLLKTVEYSLDWRCK